MSDIITLTGVVATPPRSLTTSEGLAITSFRLASSQRRFDRTQEKWVEGDTNWYTITTFRQLAANSAVSVKKGERVVVTGRLRIRDWSNGEKAGTSVDIEADAVGHDLSWGTASFSRNTIAGPTESQQTSTAPVEVTTGEFPTAAEQATADGLASVGTFAGGGTRAGAGAGTGVGAGDEPETPF
jgi:single-strand DNA-binding protein